MFYRLLALLLQLLEFSDALALNAQMHADPAMKNAYLVGAKAGISASTCQFSLLLVLVFQDLLQATLASDNLGVTTLAMLISKVRWVNA
jgi:hypothetical protein